MQILHIDTEKTWRGGENQMRLLIEGLKEHNVSCHIAAQPDSEIAKRLSGKVPLHLLPMRGGLDLSAARSIVQYCRQQGIFILDCQSSHAHSLGLLGKWLFNPNLRLIVHRRVDYVPRNNFVNRLKYRHRGVDCYIAISRKIAEILADFGIEGQRIAVARSAIDGLVYGDFSREAERHKWRQRLGLRDEALLIGQAAAMTDQKGYETLLEALALLKETGLDFHCAIAGDGFLRPSLEELRAKLKLQEQVSFLGWIDEVPSFLSSLDIFFMPSNYEGLGTTILEALYAGCCVVASDVGGIPEIIVHGKTGLLAPPRQPKDFSQLLYQAIADPASRERLNKAGKERARELFSLQAMVQGNLKVYRALQDGP